MLPHFVVSRRLKVASGWFSPTEQEESPTILWWTPFTGEGNGSYRTCGESTCFFTENRTLLGNPRVEVVVFYGSSFSEGELPLPRRPGQHWALLHEESPKNNLIFCFNPVISLFNYTATWSRNSSFPLTLLHLSSLKDLTDTQFYQPLSRKNKLQENGGLAPVVYVQSSCHAPSERDAFVDELSKFIAVDSYGKCLNNKSLPDHLQDPAEHMDDPEFLRLMAGYKFTLALENAIGDDYITEKLWRPYHLGSVPVYLGSPSVRDWIPNERSILVTSEFASAEALASHLKALNVEDATYEAMLRHKTHATVNNVRLIEALSQRQWDDGRVHGGRENFVEAFECYLCRDIHQRRLNQQKGFSSLKKTETDSSHFQCAEPIDPVTRSADPNSWWHQHWNQARVRADLVHHFVKRNKEFTSQQLEEAVLEKLRS